MRISIRKKNLTVLCAAFALVCCSAFSLSSYSVKASSSEIAVADFIKKEEGSGMAEMAVATEKGQTGLYAAISGVANKWVYQFNGTFNGNSKIEYANVGSCFDRYTFAICDLEGNRVLNYAAGGPTGTLNGAEGTYSISYVTLESEKVVGTDSVAWTSYSLNENGNKEAETLNIKATYKAEDNADARTALQNNGVFYPTQVVGASTDDKVKPGYFGLNFGEESLSVVAYTTLNGGSEQEIVAFDYADYEKIAELKDGYQIVMYSYYKGSDAHKFLGDGYNSRLPMILSINGVALNQATMTLEQENVGVYYEGEYEVDGTSYINLSKGSELGSFSAQKGVSLTSGRYGKFTSEVSGETIPYDGGAFTEAGVFDITVGGKAYKVNVIETATTSSLVSQQTGVGMNELTVMTQKGQTGLYAEINGVANRWSYAINGTFKGNSKLEYVNVSSCYDRYTFAIFDLEGNRVLNYASGPQGTLNGAEGSYSINYVTLESEKVENEDGSFTWKSYSLDTNGARDEDTLTIKATYNAADNAASRAELQDNNVFNPTHAISTSSNDKANPGYFGLNFGQESMSVVAYTNLEGGAEKEIISFNYAEYADVANLKNGYRMVIYSYYNGLDAHKFLGDGYNSRLPMLLAINGVKLNETNTPVAMEEEEITHEREVFDGTNNVITMEETDSLGEFRYTSKSLLGETLWLDEANDQRFEFSEDFTTKLPNTYDINVMRGGITKAYKVVVQASVPQIYLNDNVYFNVLTNGGALNVAKSDVLAEDKKDGVLDSSAVEIFIKAPNAADFVDYDTFTFNPTTYGRYEILYKVRNTRGVENTLLRVVENLASVPTIALNGTIPDKAYVGQSITLPDSSNAGEIVERSVVCAGEVIQDVSPLRLEKEGVYTVVYKLVDAQGNMAVATYEIAVETDYVAPVIRIEEQTQKFKRGDTITAPNATAIDDVDGEVTVHITCIFEGKEVGGQSLKATKTGIYTFVYTATDEAGNLAKSYVEVFVASAETVEMDVDETASSGGCKSSVQSMLGETILLCGIALTVILTKKKKER